jgi:protein gp37
MGTSTGIEWCHHTFNPWRGCIKVSPGCQHCYAETISKRNPQVLGIWGPNGTRPVGNAAYLRQPYKWNKAAQEAGGRRRVFCGSLMDWLEDRRDLDEPRAHLFKTISETPYLDWLLLTKRPENWHNLLQRAYGVAAGENGDELGEPVMSWISAWLRGDAPPNVWVGVSVENQERADERVPLLLDIPARVRFLSCEPLLGPVDLFRIRHPKPSMFGGRTLTFNALSIKRAIGLSTWLTPDYYDPVGDYCLNAIDWVIVGGESGSKARPMHPAWARILCDQCQEAGVAFFFKQWGEWTEAQPGVILEANRVHRWPDGQLMYRVGKKRAGRELDGREWSEFP